MSSVQSIFLYFSLFVSLFFEIFLLITYFEIRDELKFEENLEKYPSRFPSVTIIVPSFNEEESVGKTINSILALKYPSHLLSLLLIDDGSTDGTLKVLNTFKDHSQVKVLSKENGGKHTALNFALEYVETELVGCLDADSFVDKEALMKIVPFFDDEGIMAVTPSIKVHDPKTVLQHVQKVEYNWGIFLRRLLSSMDALYVTPGPFSIFRTKVFKELGGYRKAHHTEDMEYAMRMQKNRYRIVNAMGANVYTIAPRQLRALVKQRVRWTYGFLNNSMDYKEMFFNRKYGHIGVFVLPIAAISIFSTLFATGNFIWGLYGRATNSIANFNAVGFHVPHLRLDWFFINTGVVSLLSAITLIFTLGLLLLALRVAENKRPGKELLYYLSIYIFIVPLWLAKALYNTVFAKEITWR